jgi:hypothetical protein
MIDTSAALGEVLEAMAASAEQSTTNAHVLAG